MEVKKVTEAEKTEAVADDMGVRMEETGVQIGVNGYNATPPTPKM